MSSKPPKPSNTPGDNNARRTTYTAPKKSDADDLAREMISSAYNMYKQQTPSAEEEMKSPAKVPDGKSDGGSSFANYF